MSIRAQNAFSELLQNVSQTPPRKHEELRGLTFGRNIFQAFGPMLPFALFFLLMPMMMLAEPQTRAQFRAKTSAQGIVRSVQRQTTPSAANASTRVDYSFRARDGVTYYGVSYVGVDEPFAALKPGVPIPILYVSDAPQVNGIAGVFERAATSLWIVLIFPLLFVLLIFGPLFLAVQSQVLRAHPIFRRGLLAIGKVRFVARRRMFSFQQTGGADYEVFYDFTDASGQARQGSQICNNEWLLDKLEVGSEITVAYLPKKPQKSIFLEAFLA